MSLRRSDLITIISVSSVVLLISAVVLLDQRQRKAKSERIACLGNLKQIGLAFRIWSTDCGDSYPTSVSTKFGGAQELLATGAVWKVFQVMSNELSTPVILRCPSDRTARRLPFSHSDPLAWLSLKNTNLSYFVGLDAEDTRPNMFLSGDRNLTISNTLLKGVIALQTNATIAWSGELHDHVGNLGLADGSVMRVTPDQTRQLLLQTGDTTNRVAFPQ